MPKKEQPAVSEGALDLIGVNDLAPSAEIQAAPEAEPDEDTPFHVETITERQVRERAAREAALHALSAGTQKFEDTVESGELEVKIAEAEAYRDQCTRDMQTANERYVEARDVLDRLKMRRETVDTRSESDINIAYARRQFEMRMEQHQRLIEQQSALRKSGMLNEDDLARISATMLSPADRAMADKVIQARRSR